MGFAVVKTVAGLVFVVSVLVVGCGSEDSGASEAGRVGTVATTDAARGAVESTDAETTTTDREPPSTEATTTTPVAPETSYEEFLSDPDAFLREYADLMPATDSLLGESPDYLTAAMFIEEARGFGLDLTGTDIWVWPVPATGDTLLILEFDTSDVAFEDDAVGDALGEAMVKSSALDDAGITRLVISWEGSDSGGSFNVTFSVPYEAMMTAMLEGTDLAQDQVAVHIERS